jgi:hypothetical protein
MSSSPTGDDGSGDDEAAGRQARRRKVQKYVIRYRRITQSPPDDRLCRRKTSNNKTWLCACTPTSSNAVHGRVARPHEEPQLHPVRGRPETFLSDCQVETNTEMNCVSSGWKRRLIYPKPGSEAYYATFCPSVKALFPPLRRCRQKRRKANVAEPQKGAPPEEPAASG